MIKHATASTFVFYQFPDGWRLGLIEHPRLKRWMVMGGHVESDETQAEAALREVAEESGLEVQLLPSLSLSLPAGSPHPQVPQPWWILEQQVPPDNHLTEPHVHIDHQYVAIADSAVQINRPAHPFEWYRLDELAALPMFLDTLLLAEELFPMVRDYNALCEMLT